MGNNFNNSNKPNNNCANSAMPINKVAEKAINDIVKDIKNMAKAIGASAEDIVSKIAAELSVNVGDIDTRIGDVPVFSNNVVNISIGDVTVAERGGRIENTKKGGKKKKKNKK